MRKAKSCLIIIVIVLFFGAFYAISENSAENRESARSYPAHTVFKDHSPRPPAESVDTTPPLSASEIVELLNNWYETKVQMEKTQKAAPEA